MFQTNSKRADGMSRSKEIQDEISCDTVGHFTRLPHFRREFPRSAHARLEKSENDCIISAAIMHGNPSTFYNKVGPSPSCILFIQFQ